MTGDQDASSRLSPLDAAFLYFERPTQRLHVGCVAFLDGAPPFDDFVATVGPRLAAIARYRQIPVRPALDWGLPRWETDPHFDPRRHIRPVGLPAPADDATLTDLIDDLFSVPLPSDRSPWDMTLVYGLPHGRSALVTKVHHCMIDGISGAQVLTAISDPQPSAARTPDDPGPGSGERPTLLQTLMALFGRIDLHTLAEVGSTISAFVREPVSALPFNAPLSPSRSVVWAGFDLQDFVTLRGAIGCKINDAVLAVIAGALRRYLIAHEHPTDGLRVRAGVPVSVRRDDQRLSLGNLVSAVFPHLPLDVADPIDRLRRIAHEMNALKTRQQAQATGILLGLLGSLPAPLEALVGRLMPDAAVVNTICTNVPGPRERCTLAGVPITDVHPFVPLLQSMGLEFAILSYADRLSIAAAVDPDLVPDAALIPAFLRASLSELRTALGLDRPCPSVAPAGATACSVASLMSHPVLTLGPYDSLERAWLLMRQARVRHLPVVDDDQRLLGLVTHRDLLGAAPSRSTVPDDTTRVRLLGALSARDVMETHLVVAAPDDPAAAAGERMISGKIGALPVVEPGGRLVGILTTEDLLRWATCHMTAA